MNLGVIRLSDLKDDNTQSGPVRQREAIIEKYAQLGVRAEDITWAEDLDVSAFHVPPHKRPMLRRAFNALTPGSEVVFYRMDRFVRRVFPDFSDMISFAADRRLDLHSATEQLDLSGAVGMMTATMIAFMAQMGSENTSARVKNTQAYFRKTGRWKGSRLPYGYHPVKVEGKPGKYLELDPETSPIFREAIRRVINGHSVMSVTRWLNDKGVPVPTDRARAIHGKKMLCQCGHDQHDEPCEKIHKCWHRKRSDHGRGFKKLHEYDECSQTCPENKPRLWIRESLIEMLRSPALCGYTVENGGQLYLDDKGIPVPFAEPGLIDFETFKKLQQHLDERKWKKVRTHSESLLLNVAECDCGAPLYTRNVPNRAKSLLYWYYQASTGHCPDKRRNISLSVLDGLVQRELLQSLGHLDVLTEEQDSEQRSTSEVERRAVSAQIVELTTDMFVTCRPRENHNELMAQLQARYAELSAALETEEVPEARWVPSGQTFGGKWESSDTLERRLWLMDAGVKVVAVKGHMPPVNLKMMPPRKRRLIAARDGDVCSVICLGDLGETLRWDKRLGQA